MIDHFIIFTKTGSVLWSKTLMTLQNNPIEYLIKNVLMEEKCGKNQSITNGLYSLKWTLENKYDLVFAVVYQKILQLLYIEELLDKIKKDFVNNFQNDILGRYPINQYDKRFNTILNKLENSTLKKKVSHNTTNNNNSIKIPLKQNNHSTSDSSQNEQSIGNDDEQDDDKENIADNCKDNDDKLEELIKIQQLNKQPRQMRNFNQSKKKKKKEISSSENNQKNAKKMTKWDGSKLSKQEMQELDRSKLQTEKEKEAQLEEMKKTYIGDGKDESDESDDYLSDESSNNSTSSNDSGWNFGKTIIGSFFNTISGNKILERKDLEPVIAPMKQALIGKNVASAVATELCESVISNLIGQQSSILLSSVVKQALEDALFRILTPKRNIDLIQEIYAYHKTNHTKRPYVIVFVGVNGVGKSTSLSKVAYYLKNHSNRLNNNKKLKIMIAACDTFRSGAVEQLNQHCRILNIPLYQKGYAKDPTQVAQEAIRYASNHSVNDLNNEGPYDVLLIDTAGRMQNNHQMMNNLSTLINVNQPNLVLFVGEALVGNDGIDQLSLFNKALAEPLNRNIKLNHSISTPRGIDGIFLSKFDTIDDKVGAAVSMVYMTGQPIIFIGTGQKYTNLKQLNVKMVLKSLLK